MSRQKIDLAFNGAGSDRHVHIRLAHIPVPLGNLVLENAVIPECIPGQAADLPDGPDVHHLVDG